MSQFQELIVQWHDLMKLDAEAKSLADLGMSHEQEDRILNLTAQYVAQLSDSQSETDSQAAGFASRVRFRLGDHPHDANLVLVLCERFVGSLGTTLRNEIPKTIPRAQRLQARRFVIDWSETDAVGTWPELEVSFALEDSLRYGAEQMAGAEDEKLADLLTAQMLEDLRENRVAIPRLSVVSAGTETTEFWWETPTVLVETADELEPAAALELLASEPAPLEVYLGDWVAEFQMRSCETLGIQSGDEVIYGNLHAEAQYVVDQIKLDDNDQIVINVQRFVKDACNLGVSGKDEIVGLMLNAAYFGVIESLPRKQPDLTRQRAKVVKSLNKIKAEEL